MNEPNANTSIAGAEVVNSTLPKDKQQSLGLYVNAAQAYEKWKTKPDQVKIILEEGASKQTR